MKCPLKWIMALAVAASATAFASDQEMSAHQGKEAKKACDDLGKFKASISQLRSAGPESTVGEIRQNVRQAQEDLEKFAKSSKKAAKPETEQVRTSVDRLNKDVENVPESATVAEARQMISADLEQVLLSSRQLERKLGCGMGGAGSEGEMNQGQVEPQEGEQEQQMLPEEPATEY